MVLKIKLILEKGKKENVNIKYILIQLNTILLNIYIFALHFYSNTQHYFKKRKKSSTLEINDIKLSDLCYTS